MRREVLRARCARIPPAALVTMLVATLAGQACAEACRRVYERSQLRAGVQIGHVVEAALAALREPPRRP